MNVASEGTVRAEEARHFGAMAADWWDPKGRSAPLHRLNPPRLRYIREQVDQHWGADPRGFRPLAGRRALDLGCGAGLLAEPLARLGAQVTGIDAAPELVEAARAHAEAAGLAIDYRAGSVEALRSGSPQSSTLRGGKSGSPQSDALRGGAGERFDLVTSLEVVEHTADPAAFVRGLADAVADGGLLIMSTPNRTPLSRLAMITLAEGTGVIPRGTHDWSRFLTPPELTALVEAAGLRVVDVRGLAFSVARGFELSDDTRLDYFVTAVRP